MSLSISVTLPADVYNYVLEHMEKTGTAKRSVAIANLIRLGWVYRYKVLPAWEEWKREKGDISQGDNNTISGGD
jgi:hypothetical protein